MKRGILAVAALIMSLPGLIILANFAMWALTGSTFLPTGDYDMNYARAMIAIVSVAAGCALAATRGTP